MKRLKLSAALLAAAVATLLSGCSTHTPYYDNDGPPAVFTGSAAENAVPP